MEGGNLKLVELNQHLICVLCGGYLIDATSIVECLHSFCRTCIVHYLHTSNYCPVCEVLVHKKNPLEHIRPDTILQDLVYKTVPGLFKEEMRRRREFYENLQKSDLENLQYIPDVGSRVVFSPDEKISLCLKFSSRLTGGNDSGEFADSRYLLCPAGIRVEHLKKFLRSKFALSDLYEIDCCVGNELLEDHYTLIDVAYIANWKREKVLHIKYAFYELPVKLRDSHEIIPELPVAINDKSELAVAIDDTCSNSCLSSVTNVDTVSDDECFNDSGCEVNDSQISHDESALSDIVEQQESLCGIDLSMKTLRRNSLEGNRTLSHNNNDSNKASKTTDRSKENCHSTCSAKPTNSTTSIASTEASKSYMTSYVSFLGKRESCTPIKLPLRSPTSTSTPSTTPGSLDDSGNVEDISTSVTSPQNNNYMILNNSDHDKPLTLKIRKPSCDLDNNREGCMDKSGDKHSKCVGVCNGHNVKSKSDKLLLRLSRDGDSNNYTASMS